MLATGLGPALLVRRPARALRPSRNASLGDSLKDALVLMRSQPYLRNLAGLVLAGTVTLTLADYIFKSYVAQNVPAEELGSFFAVVYGVLNLLALLCQIFLVGLLLRTLGLHRSLWVLPSLLVLGAGGVGLGLGVAAALFL
jgi:ATP/ADP translocase